MHRLDDEPVLALSDEVAEALGVGRPVVALESTLLAHGLPAERRRSVALELEGICRAEGAAPATIAILDGRLRVGLDDEALARVIDGTARKASLRDLAPAVALGGVWATTVASTLAVAARCGIRWFATGGLGGVHRGVSETYDESADLLALARYPVGVVCAGAKSVLDLPKTLERLETAGVPLVGFRTDELPAFYHPHGGLPLTCRVDTAEEAARIAVARFDRLGQAGLVVCQPPPEPLPAAEVEAHIRAAVEEADRRGVGGRELTPFLLAELARRTDGASVRANVALVEANARLAARLAGADVALRRTR